MKLLFAFLFILNMIGCTQKSVYNIQMPDDSVLIKSYSIHKKANEIMELADKTTKEKIKEVAKKVEKLKIESKNIKNIVSKIDTVYVVEKRNFWGKTKRIITTKELITDTTIEQ